MSFCDPIRESRNAWNALECQNVRIGLITTWNNTSAVAGIIAVAGILKCCKYQKNE